VGALQAKKGHAYLIAACHLLKERGLGFNCTIIGGGPTEAALRQQIQASGLQDRVELLGARSHPEIIAAYRQHDLFVLASVVAPGGDRDGIPVVLMEAGKAGLPLISTRVSGIPELVRHNQTGWLVPPGDTAALADAIAALAANPAMRARLGKNARALVEAQFNIESNALRLTGLFQNTVQQCKHHRNTAFSQSLPDSKPNSVAWPDAAESDVGQEENPNCCGE
jgi:glycosyltransferase involved in cell wall biosynthesis